MALIKMIIRKMLKNKALVLCLMLGSIISVGLVSSIPLYTQAVLQKYVIKDMENYQTKESKYPGSYEISVTPSDFSISDTMKELDDQDKNIYQDKKVIDFYNKRLDSFQKTDSYLSERMENLIGLPVLAKLHVFTIDSRRIKTDTYKRTTLASEFGKLTSVSGIEQHITLLDGKMPSKAPVGGIYEVLLSESALKKLDLVLGQVITLEDTREKSKQSPIKVKPVGVFTEKDSKDLYWYFNNADTFEDNLIINDELMRKDFIEKTPTLIHYSQWFYAFDYHALKTSTLNTLLSGNASINRSLHALASGSQISIEAPSIGIIQSYKDKSKSLTQMLFALYVPIIIMLCLYMFMVSKLIMGRERNEISLLASRGAKRSQVVAIYLIQGLIIGAIALITGPLLGVFLTKILGASGGFLQFADRKALPVTLNSTVFVYAILTIILSLLTLVIPAYTSSKTSIVDLKRGMVRKPRFTLWEKLFVDVILLGISAYGYYDFLQSKKILKVTSASSSQIQMNPLLFLVPVFFIIGIGLLMLRIYPFIIKLIYWLGKKLWPPNIYASLNQVGRSLRDYHFLMIFLIMALSVGIFSATAARTINLNEEEKIYYSAGSDIVLTPVWEKNTATVSSPVSQSSDSSDTASDQKVEYSEPPFSQYSQLSGVESAAKVFNKENIFMEANGTSILGTQLMAIEPYDFSKTAWFRSGLLKYHINSYLNLLDSEPSACLISKSLAEAYGIKRGDTLQIGWSGSGKADFTVYEIIDYWPSWNPNTDPNSENKSTPMLVVTNLQYIQDHVSIEPYNVWLKLKPGATTKQVYDNIMKDRLVISDINNAGQKIIELKNDPFQLGINGALTLGFVMSGFICFFGFLLYWILSIKSRTLQFGIFRAMGLSTRSLISMIAFEQIITSFAAFAAGIFIGLVTSRIFVPFFQLAFDSYSQVPPFKVVAYAGDRTKIYMLIGLAMAICISALGYIMTRIKINQAIKLGED